MAQSQVKAVGTQSADPSETQLLPISLPPVVSTSLIILSCCLSGFANARVRNQGAEKGNVKTRDLSCILLKICALWAGFVGRGKLPTQSYFPKP